MAEYLRPRELDQALAALGQGGWTVFAGGTDHFPARVTHTPDENLLDLTAITALRGIEQGPDGTRIGAAVTWSELAEAELPSAFDGLKSAARLIGGRQVQNRATVAGNICNASPAADGIPALLSLDARVEIVGTGGIRSLDLGDFVLGNRRTALAAGELVSAILVPPHPADTRTSFLKLGAREHLVISIAMVAGTARLTADGTLAAIRLAVGACSEVATRLTRLEERLTGMNAAEAMALDPSPYLASLTPIDDVRASAEYRRDAATILVRRCIAQLMGEAV